MRRAANPTRKISITIPDRIFQELERTLSYSQSRSAYIAAAIQAKLDGSPMQTITETSTLQLMAAILSRDDADQKLKDFILTYFSS
jgi:metal-responsive CopG/Arc/MetJ family transcriptional regulator